MARILYNVIMTFNNTDSLDKALLVFARQLVDEMRYINYPQEWSRSPLMDLLPIFFDVLNYHPARLGDIVKIAYERTFPVVQNDNINQLGVKMIDSTKDYELFSKSREYYLDEYEVRELCGNITAAKNDELANKLRKTYKAIINTFADLTSNQENEHRTLERVCLAMEPVYARLQGMKEVGFDLAEYADQWRNLPVDERLKLKKELVSR